MQKGKQRLERSKVGSRERALRSVQLPVKSRSSNFLLSLSETSPFLTRLALSVTRCFAARHFAFPGSQSLERTKSVCPVRVCPPPRFLPFLPANVFLAPNKTKPISESVMSGLWEERCMSGIIGQTPRHMGTICVPTAFCIFCFIRYHRIWDSVRVRAPSAMHVLYGESPTLRNLDPTGYRNAGTCATLKKNTLHWS